MATHSNMLAWESPMDGGAWQATATVHGVAQSWTQLKRLSTLVVEERSSFLSIFSIEELLGCFWFSTTKNKIAVDVCVGFLF